MVRRGGGPALSRTSARPGAALSLADDAVAVRPGLDPGYRGHVGPDRNACRGAAATPRRPDGRRAMIVHEDWLLTPVRAAVHLPTATAVVADLHLGYELARH